MKKIITGILFVGFLLSGNFLFAESSKSFSCDRFLSAKLSLGSINEDVVWLQKILNIDSDTSLPTSGLGAKGNETNYFGRNTHLSVIKFQEKYRGEILDPLKLSTSGGFVGVLTRNKLIAICNANYFGGNGASQDSKEEMRLYVESTEQPAHASVLSGAGGVPFLKFKVRTGSSDAVITGIGVELVGPVDRNAFESVAIVDEDGNEVGEESPLGIDRKIKFKTDLHLNLGESKELLVLGNMSEDLEAYNGQLPTFGLVSIEANLPVSANLPILGAKQVINSSLAIGGAESSLSQYDPGTNRQRHINDTRIIFSGIRLTANSKEDLKLVSISWSQNGTADDNDLSNVVTYVDDQTFETELSGRSYESSFGEGIIIKKGHSVDIYIKGGVLPSGANRTVKFDLDESGDISLEGIQYGYGVGVSASGNTSVSGNSSFITSDGTPEGEEGNPFFSGSVVTINPGTVGSVGRSGN